MLSAGQPKGNTMNENEIDPLNSTQNLLATTVESAQNSVCDKSLKIRFESHHIIFLPNPIHSASQHRSGDRGGVWSWKLHDNTKL